MSETIEHTDYSPAVPRRVREAALRAEELLAREHAAAAGDQPAGDDLDQGPPPNGSEPAPPAEIAPPPPPAYVPPTPQPDLWEHRYQTLQGKYNAETRALQRQLDEIRAELDKARTAPPAATVAASSIPDNDISEFGEDLVAAARRWARAEVDADFTKMRGELTRVQQTLAEVQGTAVGTRNEYIQNQVMTALNNDRQLGPVWQQINVSAPFVDWLARVDPFSGIERHSLLTAAYEAGDFERTSEFFRAYLREHTAVTQPAPAPVHTPPGADGTTLADLAAPGRSTGPTTVATGAPAARIWTDQSIRTFYAHVREGRYQGREAQQRQLEADIASAAGEGRYRPR